jgi:hypothetical protein
MLDVLEAHIRSNASRWGLDVPTGAHLSALVRANPEHDGVVQEFGAGQVGTVLFWFRSNDRVPFLVSKIVGASLSVQAIRDCDAIHQRANAVLGYSLFPALYDVSEHQGAAVVFMEALEGPNYDVELARAATGPERSSAALRRVVARQLGELGKALRDLRQVRLSDGVATWGEPALRHAEDFFGLCPAAREAFGAVRLERMRALIDSEPLETHLVLTEDHVANYLPGPRAVDQLVADLPALCRSWPGPVDGLRLLISLFRASPLHEAFSDYHWVDALAACTLGEEEHPVLGPPVKQFLADLGLGSARTELLWALLTGVFFLRGWQELRFHSRNPLLADRLRAEYLGFARRMAGVFDATAKDRPAIRLRVPRLDVAALDGEFADREAPSFMSPQRVFVEPREANAPPLVQAVRVALAPYPRLRRAARVAYRLARTGRLRGRN